MRTLLATVALACVEQDSPRDRSRGHSRNVPHFCLAEEPTIATCYTRGMSDDVAEGAARPVDPEVVRVLVENHREFLGFLERRVGRRDVAEDLL